MRYSCNGRGTLLTRCFEWLCKSFVYSRLNTPFLHRRQATDIGKSENNNESEEKLTTSRGSYSNKVKVCDTIRLVSVNNELTSGFSSNLWLWPPPFANYCGPYRKAVRPALSGKSTPNSRKKHFVNQPLPAASCHQILDVWLPTYLFSFSPSLLDHTSCGLDAV